MRTTTEKGYGVNGLRVNLNIFECYKIKEVLEMEDKEKAGELALRALKNITRDLTLPEEDNNLFAEDKPEEPQFQEEQS